MANKKIIKNQFIYDLDNNVQFHAYWKSRLTGTLEIHQYPPYALPKDKVKVVFLNFPIKNFSITKVYAESSDNKKTEPAKLLVPPEATTGSKDPPDFTFELLPILKEFCLVIEGKSSKGKSFIHRSVGTFKTTNQTDKEIADTTWAAFLSSFKDNMSKEEKAKMLKEAFEL